MKKSSFLKKEDVGAGALVTIKEVAEENIAKEGAPPEYKWCLFTVEHEKPMVLNSTNGQLIAKITGKNNTDEWPGHKIVLYDDPSVSFGGKITGGIRVRAPRGQAAKAAQPAAAAPAPSLPQEVDHETPF